MSVLSTILGSGDVISKGLNLIDDMHTSKEEEIIAKTKAKTDLLKSYAPFKVAQRYLAVIFASNFVASFWLVLVLYFLGHDISGVMEIIAGFNIGVIMLVIVTFYFGGGAFEGVMSKRENK